MNDSNQLPVISIFVINSLLMTDYWSLVRSWS